MFKATPLSGFSNPYVLQPQFRFVGAYACNWNTSLTASATIPIADLRYPANANRQILVWVYNAVEFPDCFATTINGVYAPPVIIDQVTFRFQAAYAAPFAGTSDFDIDVVRLGTGNEAQSILVFEVYDALPLHQSLNISLVLTTLSVALTSVMPQYSGLISASSHFDETAAYSWGSTATEVVDVAGGASRLSAAVTQISPGAASSDVTISATSSSAGASTMALGLLSVLPRRQPFSFQFCGNQNSLYTPTISGSTATIVDDDPQLRFLSDLTGMGSPTLYLVITAKTDQSLAGVTFNGAAMTEVASAINTNTSPDLRIYLYRISITQASPVGDIVATFSGSVVGNTIIMSGMRAYTNTGPVAETIQTATGNGTSGSVNINVTQGANLFAVHIRDTATQSVTWSGALERVDGSAGSFRYSHATYPFINAETGRTISATAVDPGQYAHMVFALNATNV